VWESQARSLIEGLGMTHVVRGTHSAISRDHVHATSGQSTSTILPAYFGFTEPSHIELFLDEGDGLYQKAIRLTDFCHSKSLFF
jgi:hypothetical protein